MVSYPSDDAPSPSRHSSACRTSSVMSSSVSTVRRRHHRGTSLAGPSSSTRAHASNEFPFFTHTGDVEIIIPSDPSLRRRRDSGRGSSGNGEHGQERRYRLHRLILAQCSAFFDVSTSEDQWSRAQASNNQRDGASTSGQLTRYNPSGEVSPTRQTWCYELDWSKGDDEAPMLVRKDASLSLLEGDTTGTDTAGHMRPPPIRPKPQPPPSGFFRSMANLSALTLSHSHSRSQSSSRDPQPDPLHPSELQVQAYDSLFRIFYNYAPGLHNTDIAHAYVECKALLQLADMYGALEVVGPRVDHHLLRFGTRLWKQIAKYPPSYLRIGYLAKSKAIFTEAVIHVVGSWPSCAQQLGYVGPLAPRGSRRDAAPQTQLPEAVFELIEDKVENMEDLKAKVEARLWRLTLTTSRGERVTPANSWLDWLAMSLFRQWLAETTTPPPAPILKDSSNLRGSRGSTSVSNTHSTSLTRRPHPPPPASLNGTASVVSASASLYPQSLLRGEASHKQQQRALPPFNAGRVFRLLGQGGEAYLPHAELKAFLKLHPENYDREKLKRFERRVVEIKNLARDAVKPLMRNFLSVDVLGAGAGEREGVVLGYLTCTRVEEGDYPWDE